MGPDHDSDAAASDEPGPSTHQIASNDEPADDPSPEESESDELDPGEPAPVRPGWRRRTARGALMTGMALGLQQVFEEKRDEPGIMIETSGVPPEDLAVEAGLDGLAPRRSVVKIRPWLLGSDVPEDRESDTAPRSDTPPPPSNPGQAR